MWELLVAVQISSNIEGSVWDDKTDLGLTTRVLMSSVGATAIDELSQWYEDHWKDSRLFKDELIELLDASKFGEYEYSPYQVYMKALYTYLQDELDSAEDDYTKSAVELTEFQEDAVKKARNILLKYNGVLIGDSVGLGKTWIAKKLLEDYAYHMRQKALVISPASLQDMWKHELSEAGIPAQFLSQEKLGREEFDTADYGDMDVILIDESHNFRNAETSRYANMERIISMNGGKGREGHRKVLILMTATPINNSLFDLYSQLSLITQNQRDYFSAAGIGDLRKYFLRARRTALDGSGTIPIFNLLEEIVIRRSRNFVKTAYPEATIHGKRISWPERELNTLTYDLEESYKGIYRDIITKIETLRLAPYSLERYKKKGVKTDYMEIGREEALVAIFKTRFLKRFESSIHAFRISIRRSLEFLKTFEDYLLDGKLLDSSSFRELQRLTEQEGEEDDATPTSLSEEFDASTEATRTIESLEELDISEYNLKEVNKAIRNDIESLEYAWEKIKDITHNEDRKLQSLKDALRKNLKDQKLLIFSYYKDTEKYLFEYFTNTDEGKRFIEEIGGPTISRLDSEFSPKNRRYRIRRFSPISNGKPEIVGTDEEIDIMLSTDVLSEGQNLQDCGLLLNYDLHWNPMRMVQREGRIDRLGSKYPKLHIYNFFPEDELEDLLGLVGRISTKIQSIDGTGFHDTSILGEVPHPRDFNTLRRILAKDGSVFEEEEKQIELASNEVLKRRLIEMLQKDGRETIDGIPDGIHSGRRIEDARGLFFYFILRNPQGAVQHFWKYYDLNDNQIIDNRYIISNRIACNRDEPRVIPHNVDVFGIQEEIKKDIMKDIGDAISLEKAPKRIETEQQTIVATLQDYLNQPGIDRRDLMSVLRGLERPLARVYVKRMREAYKSFIEDEDIGVLIQVMKDIMLEIGDIPRDTEAPVNEAEVHAEDLHLVCFEYIS
jgi:superfamily II DNA or RNA helicase